MKRNFRVVSVQTLLVIAALGCKVHAQEPPAAPVAVRGKVLSLEMESNESWRLKYKAKIDLRFVNVSHRPVIIARHDPLWIESAYATWDEDGQLAFSGTETALPIRYPDLNHAVPPTGKAVVLAPGDAYTTSTTGFYQNGQRGHRYLEAWSGTPSGRHWINLGLQRTNSG